MGHASLRHSTHSTRKTPDREQTWVDGLLLPAVSMKAGVGGQTGLQQTLGRAAITFGLCVSCVLRMAGLGLKTPTTVRIIGFVVQ